MIHRSSRALCVVGQYVAFERLEDTLITVKPGSLLYLEDQAMPRLSKSLLLMTAGLFVMPLASCSKDKKPEADAEPIGKTKMMASDVATSRTSSCRTRRCRRPDRRNVYGHGKGEQR
jgi:hypothetical protein